jgi:acetoin utilization deacetylase AcuC-like enzyme
MDRVAGGAGQGRVVSLLEGGYDTQPQTLGLARCVDAHVHTLRSGGL